ncbi:MAG: SpoIIE family protein phosphatase [Chromatiales bacterium]|nr:MAG: SpoIIE family protein phosphatase [Chromatiales bacterium]
MSRKGVPFQRSLLLNVTAGVLLLGACLLMVSVVATGRVLEGLSGSLTKRIIATTDARVMSFFEPVQLAIEITAERVHGGGFENFPIARLDDYFAPLVAGIPQLSSMLYAHANGDEYMLMRTDDRWQSRQTRPETWGGAADWREWQAGAKVKPVQRRDLDYDARQRPWHQGAMQRFEQLGPDAPAHELVHWTAPYRFFTTQEPGVTASIAHRLASGRVIVLGADITLSEISKFTSTLEIGERGKVFVLRGKPADPMGLVVVGLPADARFDDEQTMVEFVLTPPQELGGPVASFVNQAIAKGGSALGAAVPFEHDGERWWGALERSKLRTSDNIWVGSVLPEEQLLDGLPNTNRIVLAATGIFVLLAIWRAFRLAARYATPLEELNERGHRMQRLDFERVETVDSDITEIRDLTATLERMRRALQSFSSEREDLRIARSIRAMTMPAQLPAPTGFTLRAWQEPAEEVGGEFYDAVQLPATVGDPKMPAGVVLAFFDVPGTGLAATVHDNQLRAAFRADIETPCDLRKLAGYLDQFVHDDLPDIGPVRVCLVKLDGDPARAEVLGLGQDVLMARRGGPVEKLQTDGQPLGLGRTRDVPEATAVALEPGDTIIVASNGVRDAVSAERKRFGIDGIQAALEAVPGGTVDDLIAQIRKALAGYSSGPCNDRTLVVLRVTG